MAAAGNNFVFVLPKPTPDLTIKHQQHQPIYVDQTAAVYSAPAKFGGTPSQLKPPKRLRKDNNPITRCKRRLDFARLGLPGMQTQNPVIAARRNERERNRVKHINDTFTVLRDHLPSEFNTVNPINKEMSKVEILRAAIDYIQTLEEMLAGKLQITPDVDLKALIQASTSPDSKTSGFDKDMVKKLMCGSQSREDVSTPSSVFSNESVSDSATSEQYLQEQLSSALEQLVQSSSIGELKNQSFPTAMNSFISNDLNANEVKSFTSFLDQTVHPDKLVQHNQISQSNQYDTIQADCGLLSNERIQNTQHNVQTNAQTVTGQVQDSTQSQVINNGTINVNIGAYGQYPNMPAATAYGPGFEQSQNSALFDGLDLAEVDFTSLLMGCD